MSIEQYGLRFVDYSVAVGGARIIHSVTLHVATRALTSIIGPSGCGKSTLLRAALQLHDRGQRAETEGQVLRGDIDLLRLSGFALEQARKEVAYISQRPTAFPESIYSNIALPFRYWNRSAAKQKIDEAVEWALLRACCWDEFKDRLAAPAANLSAGQLQRLSIARALVLDPPVVLFDEPCASADPIVMQKLEQTLYELKQDRTLLVVTHNMQQAARISDHIAFLMLGKLVEYDQARTLMITPREKLTEDYITGRFG